MIKILFKLHKYIGMRKRERQRNKKEKRKEKNERGKRTERTSAECLNVRQRQNLWVWLGASSV